MLGMAADPWFNQNWFIAAASLLVGAFGGLVLLSQLRALNQKNKFDLLQFVAGRMSQRFGEGEVPPRRGFFEKLVRVLSSKSEDEIPLRRPASGLQGYYSLKRRFREVRNLPANTRGCRGERAYLTCLVARIGMVRDIPQRARQADFVQVRQYVNAVNDVAEMIEEGLVDIGTFLSKYHLSLIREVYIAEPYIYHYNVFSQSGRWAMRVLRLGEMARQFNDISPIHRQPVFFTDDLEFECIYDAPGGRLLWVRKEALSSKSVYLSPQPGD